MYQVTLNAERNDSETQRSNYGYAKKKTPTGRYVLEERKEGLQREVSDLPERIRMERYSDHFLRIRLSA